MLWHDVFRLCKDYGASDFPGLTGETPYCADPLTIPVQEGPVSIQCETSGRNDEFDTSSRIYNPRADQINTLIWHGS